MSARGFPGPGGGDDDCVGIIPHRRAGILGPVTQDHSHNHVVCDAPDLGRRRALPGPPSLLPLLRTPGHLCMSLVLVVGLHGAFLLRVTACGGSG